MQIGEKDLALPQKWKLRLARLLDFHNHVRARENVSCLIDNFCAGFDVFFVWITGIEPRIFFHEHGMTAQGELVRGRWQTRHALLLFLTFFRYAYNRACSGRT